MHGENIGMRPASRQQQLRYSITYRNLRDELIT
jgi:hypothetical protein